MTVKPAIVASALAALVVPAPALAYVGPGVGLGAIMATIAVVLGLILLAVGFLWYPLKRVLRRGRTPSDKSVGTSD